MNHFADLADGSVLNSKTLGQRFERAIVALMRELRIKHIERNHAALARDFLAKDEFRIGIDKITDEPG